MKKNHLFRIATFSLLYSGLASSQTTRALYDFNVDPQESSVDTDTDTTASNFAINPSGMLGAALGGPGFSTSSFSAFVRLSQTSANNLTDAITNEQYSSFTLTIDNGPIDLGAVNFRHFVTTFNANVDYNVALLSNLTGFTADDAIAVVQPSTANTDGVTSEIPLLDSTFTALSSGMVVEFRLYYFDDSNAQNQIYRVDDIEVLTQPLPDPLFNLSESTTDPDLEFPNTFSLGTDLTRTVVYEASSASGTGTVTVDALTITGDTDHSTGGFSVSSVPPVPVTLNDGETIAITVTADSSEAGAFNGSLLIDTTAAGNQEADALDTTVASSSNFFTIGDKLNPNSAIEGNAVGWGGAPSFIQPGIAPNSASMFRLKGEGDSDGNSPDSAFQAAGIPDGASDFEFTAFFSPINAANFVDYTSLSPAGNFGDRTFQWFLLSSDSAITTANFTDDSAEAALINLAYLPDGNVNGGAPDFYVFDGANWVATGIGAIEGSFDNGTTTGDGLLDTEADALDVINVYRLSVRGTGFGTPSASYDISVTNTSGPDTFTSGSATSLTVFHGVSGTTATPASMGFTTGDVSVGNIGSNFDGGFTTSFWVDEACLSNVEFVDAAIPSVSTSLLELSSHNNSPALPTGTITITNTALVTELELSSISLSGNTGITIPSVPSTPITLASGESIDIEVTFDPSLITPLTAELATLSITSDSVTLPTQTVMIVGLATSDSNLIANCDFEVAGTDNLDDLDTFAAWTEGNNDATRIETTDVPGLIAGSSTAAYLNRNTIDGTATFAEVNGSLEGGNTSNFSLESYFAISEPITEATATEESSRIFNFFILGDGGGFQMNIRYIEEDSGTTGIFQAFQAGWQDLISLSSPLIPSVAANGDGDLSAAGSTSNVYRLKLDATAMGSADASYSLEIFDVDGTSLGASTTSSIFQTPVAATSQLPGTVQFLTEFGENAPFWVDEACASILTISEDIVITDCDFAGPGNDFTINFTGATSTTYNVEASANLVDDFAPISGVTTTTDASGIGTATVPAASVGSDRNFFRISE